MCVCVCVCICKKNSINIHILYVYIKTIEIKIKIDRNWLRLTEFGKNVKMHKLKQFDSILGKKFHFEKRISSHTIATKVIIIKNKNK